MEYLNLLTAILGLIASIIAFTKRRTIFMTEKATKDDFKTFKQTLNQVGIIFLILIAYFGFIIVMMLFPKILSSTVKFEKENKEEISKNFNFNRIDSLKSDNQLLCLISVGFSNYNEKDKYLDIVLRRCLKSGEYDNALSIINNFSSQNKKDESINTAFKFLCEIKEYKYAFKMAMLHSSSSAKDENLLFLFKEISK